MSLLTRSMPRARPGRVRCADATSRGALRRRRGPQARGRRLGRGPARRAAGGQQRARRLIALAALAAPFACGASSERIVVLVNAESPVSVAIGDYYCRKNGIPKRNRIDLHVPLEDPSLEGDAHETISRAEFQTLVRDPIAQHLEANGLRTTTEILVITKGVPLRVDGPHVPMGTWLRDSQKASVDAELALLFTSLDGRAGVEGLANPYFGSDLPFSEYRRREGEAALPRYLVARLTGYAGELDPETGIPLDVRALIDARDAEPEHAVSANAKAPAAIWLIDADETRDGPYAAGDRVLLSAAAGALRALGLPVEHDRAARFRADLPSIQGYASWGSNDAHNAGLPYYGDVGGQRYPGRFAPRSVALDFVSTNARSFAEPPSYGQSLVADLLHLGAAGAGGHVFEPTLPGVHRPDLFLRRYALGAPAVEAYWSSVPYLGWMNVWIGDPLLRLESPVKVTTRDRDADGVPDDEDNCTRIPNPAQRDTDSDGYGNFCDADINNDGRVTSSWGQVFPLGERGDIEWIRLTAQSGIYDENHDLDGDGKVDSVDVSIAQLGLEHPPGPSGRRRER